MEASGISLRVDSEQEQEQNDDLSRRDEAMIKIVFKSEKTIGGPHPLLQRGRNINC